MSQQELIPIQHHPRHLTTTLSHPPHLPSATQDCSWENSGEHRASCFEPDSTEPKRLLPTLDSPLPRDPHAHLSFPSLQQFVLTRHILLAEVWDTGRPARKVVRETVGVIKGRVGCLCAHSDAGQGFSGIHGDPHPAFLVSLTPARLSVLLLTSHCLPLSKLRIGLLICSAWPE